MSFPAVNPGDQPTEPSKPRRGDTPDPPAWPHTGVKRGRELVRAALEGMNEFVAICDARGRVVVLSSAMERFVRPDTPWRARRGVAPSLNQNALDGAAIAPVDATLARALRGETLTDVRAEVDTAFGERRSMVASGQQLLSADGVLLGGDGHLAGRHRDPRGGRRPRHP